MNATSLGELRGLARDVQDEKMEQIRELLFGDYQRASEARIALLEARIRELEVSLHRRLDALHARLDAVTGEAGAERRTAFDELARGVQDLGERIKRLSRD